MPTVQNVPWWLDRVAVPISFTLFGALLGLMLGRLKDWLDDRKAKRTFLKATRVELSVVREHLHASASPEKLTP